MAILPSPTLTWDTIQNVFYRKEELYQMGWSIPDLSDYLIAAVKNGGPIAMIRDERKVMLLGKHAAGKPKIHIYTASGILLSSLNWDLTPPILMHFTTTHLLVVSDEGIYRLYDLSNPQQYTQHTLGSEATEMGLLSAKGYDDGFVVLTGGLQFLEVRGWKGAKVTPLSATGLAEPPTAWAVIPPEQSSSGHIEILVSIGPTILTIDALDRIDQLITRGPFSHILPSPNGRFLALLTATGSLWVVSADFARNLSDVSLNDIMEGSDVGGIPDTVAWCGDNAVVLAWGGKVVVVGPSGDCLRYDHSPSVHLVTELDGLRMISSTTSDLIQKVHDSSLAVFSPGSSHPAAVLYDALDHFDRRSPKADESIRSIRPDLGSAVDTCIDAAGREWDANWQRRLLRAAQFGRAFLDLYNASDFVGMAQTLKVLNAIRYYEIGIPLTYDQYLLIGPTSLISQLLSRNLHLLALRISQYLSLRPDPVLKHWAAAKISRAKGVDPSERGVGEDEALCRTIVSKFEKEGERGVSYADIARKAWEAGRVRLATMLLDHERRAAETVPLLLQMKEDKVALAKAIDSGDTDLVYHVLLHLHASLSPGDFFHTLDDSADPKLTPAIKLLQAYAREGDRRLLRDFYYQDDRRTENACLDMQEAAEAGDPEDRVGKLRSAAKAFGEDKERQFEAKMAEDAHRLLALQIAQERELDHKFQFAGLSVDQYISRLLSEGFSKRAEKVRVDYKVPDKRWWWVKLKALAGNKDWEGLEAFAKSKKSPIGYEPFVIMRETIEIQCRMLTLKSHLLSLSPPQPVQAATFVPRCDAKLRADLYVQCGDWGKAAEAAKDRNDKAKLEQLRRSAPNGIAQREVDEVIKRMK